MINLGDDFVPVADLQNPQQLPFGCQWILSRLTAAVDSTVKALHEYQFSTATQASRQPWQAATSCLFTVESHVLFTSAVPTCFILWALGALFFISWFLLPLYIWALCPL